MYLPPEILVKIFRMTKRCTPYDLAVNRTLPKLARVNKDWLAAAREVLYSNVYLGNQENLADTVKHLLRTLTQAPHLATRVHAIYYGSFHMIRSETANLARIITLCGPLNLRHLQIHGYNGYELKSLREAMKKAVNLHSFQISRFSLSGMECSPFCSVAQFFEILQCWPDLRSMMLYQDLLTDYWTSSKSKKKFPFPVTPGILSNLTRLEDRDNLYAKHLLALTHIAPNLATLILTALPVFTPEGLSVLHGWKDSLTHLIINTDPESAETRDVEIGDVLASMPNLRILELSAKCLPSTAFDTHIGFLSLQQLTYRIEKQSDDLDILTKSLLAQPPCLPAMRQVAVRTDYSFSWDGGFAKTTDFREGAFAAFKAACAGRGIRLKEAFDNEQQRKAAQMEMSEEQVAGYFEMAADEIDSEDEEWETEEDDDDTGEDDDDEGLSHDEDFSEDEDHSEDEEGDEEW
ncbi:hypothetical protein BV25DRAFT_1217136 [Artomyces pyxidatus]|uniref:Uncharacterized protein n=1 Tax=Artomyces pyxidatus TaxID=48021 RepID=A0ACB8SR19_9AGAM|nr:hypothetical protein BV25DRAFT_1217136 [Artomyces pyxidatus]